MYLVRIQFKNAVPHYLQVQTMSVRESDGKSLTTVGATEDIAKATRFPTKAEADTAHSEWVFDGEYDWRIIPRPYDSVKN